MLKRFVVGCCLCVLLCLGGDPTPANAFNDGNFQQPKQPAEQQSGNFQQQLQQQQPLQNEKQVAGDGLPTDACIKMSPRTLKSFKDKKFKYIKLDEATQFYRYYSDPKKREVKSLYLTTDYYTNNSEAILGLALNQSWPVPNKANMRVKVTLPEGMTVIAGVAAPQSVCYPGGGKQYLIKKECGSNDQLWSEMLWSAEGKKIQETYLEGSC